MSLHSLMIAIDDKEVDKSQSLLFDLIEQYSKDNKENIFNDHYFISTMRAMFKRNLVDPFFIQFIEGFSLSPLEIYSILLLVADKVTTEHFNMLFDRYGVTYSTLFPDSTNKDLSFLTFLQNNNFYFSLKRYGFLDFNIQNDSQFIYKLSQTIISSPHNKEYLSYFHKECGLSFLRIYHKIFIQCGQEQDIEEYKEFLFSLGRLDKQILLKDTKDIIDKENLSKDIESSTIEQKERTISIKGYLENIILNKRLNHGLQLHKKENVKKHKI